MDNGTWHLNISQRREKRARATQTGHELETLDDDDEAYTSAISKKQKRDDGNSGNNSNSSPAVALPSAVRRAAADTLGPLSRAVQSVAASAFVTRLPRDDPDSGLLGAYY
jgi:hypothetical protein